MQDLIRDMSHFHIFPFTLQGCINVTETGLKPEALNVNDYTYFSKVISGDSQSWQPGKKVPTMSENQSDESICNMKWGPRKST